MNKKFSPDNPMRPRNQRKRQQRTERELRKQARKRQDTETKQPQQPQKVFHADSVRKVKDYISRLNKKITLPFTIDALREGQTSKCVIINREGRERELLPDRKGVYKILVHSNVAKVITSGMCILAKITQHEKIDAHTAAREWIDGSWSIAPCVPSMLNGTTVQHVRRRRWWFLRRYWYEISFDGRVQPGGMFYDYDISPVSPKETFYITHEFVKVRHSNAQNDYFRFWRYKSNIK